MRGILCGRGCSANALPLVFAGSLAELQKTISNSKRLMVITTMATRGCTTCSYPIECYSYFKYFHNSLPLLIYIHIYPTIVFLNIRSLFSWLQSSKVCATVPYYRVFMKTTKKNNCCKAICDCVCACFCVSSLSLSLSLSPSSSPSRSPTLSQYFFFFQKTVFFSHFALFSRLVSCNF